MIESEIDLEDISDELDSQDIVNLREYSYAEDALHATPPSMWSQGQQSEKCALRDDDFEIEMSDSTRNLVMGHDDAATTKINRLEETRSDETRSRRNNQVAGAALTASHRGSITESTPLIERRALQHVAIDVAEEAVEEGARLRTVSILGRCMISVARFMLCVARCWTVGASWLLTCSEANASEEDI